MSDNEEYQVAIYESEESGSDESDEEIQKKTRTRELFIRIATRKNLKIKTKQSSG